MINISFEEFYYTEDNQIHYLDEVQKEYEQKHGDISKYRGRMVCPECKKAELRFTHKTSNRRAFLSKIPSSEHEGGCSFIHDYATNSEIKQFAKTLTKKQIQDRLEAVLNQLLPKKEKDCNGVSNESKNNPFIIKVVDKKGSSIRRSIPRKSINSWFDKSEEKKVFIFYGYVKLSNEEIKNEKGKYFRLIVKTKNQNEWKKKTSVFRGTIPENIDEEKNYYIAVLGEIEFYKGFPQIKTTSFDAIMLREARTAD